MNTLYQNMKQYNIDRLESYRNKLNEWTNDKTCHLDSVAKNEIIGIIREEFNPAYHVDLWCGKCVVDMLVYAFREMDARVKTDTVNVKMPTTKRK